MDRAADPPGGLRGRRLWAVGGVALAVTLGAVVVATQGDTKVDELEIDEDQPLAGIDNPVIHGPADVDPGTLKVLLVGDSGAAEWGPSVVRISEQDDTVAVAFAAQITCSVIYADGPSRLPDGCRIDREPCDGDRIERWTRLVDEYDPDVVVYYVANVGFVEEHRLDGEWVPECDPRYDGYLEDALADEVDLLTSGDARFVFTASPYTATTQPAMPAEVDCRNATIRRVADAHPGVRVADLNAFVAAQGTDVDMFSDPVHLSRVGGRRAARWLLPQIEGWYGCDSPDPLPTGC